MYFFIIDNETEIIGTFENEQIARLYYIKKNVVEKLKLLRHKMMNETFPNIYSLRNIEDLMEEIFLYDIEDTEGNENTINDKINYFLSLSNNFLNDTSLKISYKIIKFDGTETIRHIKIK